MVITKKLEKPILFIVLIIALFSVFAVLVPEGQSSGDELTDSGRCVEVGGYYNTTVEECHVSADNSTSVSFTPIPIGNIFASTGFIWVIVMLSLLIIVVKRSMDKK